MELITYLPVRSASSAPATLDRWFADQGSPQPIDLARSGAASLTLAELLARTGAGADDLMRISLDYGPGRGGSRLRSAVAANLGTAQDIEVVVASGAVEALLLLCVATAGGGHVLVGTPSYSAILSAPAAAGRRVRLAPVWDSRGGLQFETLAGEITADTSLVIVNRPHNPTGALATLDELDELAERCAARGALLVVDEVSRGTLAPSTPSAVSSRGFAAGTTVVLGDVSKSLGLGGLRIGWLALADRVLAGRVAAAKDGTTVASSSLSEHLAALALEHADVLLEPITAAAQRNLRTLVAFLDGRGDGPPWTPPTDGLTAFPAIPTCAGTEALAEDLRRRHVGVVPGSLFGEPDHLRLGIGGPPQLFNEGLRRLERALDRE